jgi:hypothetical protein
MQITPYVNIISSGLNAYGSCNAPGDTPTVTGTLSTAMDACGGMTASAGCRYHQVERSGSTLLWLMIDGVMVMGGAAVLPFKTAKARRPTLATLTRNQIRANLQQAVEGTTGPCEVVFTLRWDIVSLREGERVRKEGKWGLKAQAQGYACVFTKSACA